MERQSQGEPTNPGLPGRIAVKPACVADHLRHCY